MDQTEFIKDPPALLIDLMRKTFGDRFNAYFLGSPTMIPEGAYPCCIVQFQTSTNSVTGAPTGHDSVSELITIHFLENSKDSADATDAEETSIRKIYDYVQGRDPSSGWYRPDTALYALRTNLDLTTSATGYRNVIDHDIDTNYNVTPRQDMPTIIEAVITIVTRERIPVNR